jgi:deoxyhypusine synthase
MAVGKIERPVENMQVYGDNTVVSPVTAATLMFG